MGVNAIVLGLWELDPPCTGINDCTEPLAVKNQALYLRLTNNSVSNYSVYMAFK